MNKHNAAWKTFTRLSPDGLPEIVVAAENGCPLAVVSNHAEIRETARLISAAPDLLIALAEELENVEDDIRWAEGGELDRLIIRREKLEAVIAKAGALS